MIGHIDRSMKPRMKKIKDFFEKEWFLLVMIAAIGLIVFLFQFL